MKTTVFAIIIQLFSLNCLSQQLSEKAWESLLIRNVLYLNSTRDSILDANENNRMVGNTSDLIQYIVNNGNDTPFFVGYLFGGSDRCFATSIYGDSLHNWVNNIEYNGIRKNCKFLGISPAGEEIYKGDTLYIRCYFDNQRMVWDITFSKEDLWTIKK